MDCWRKENNKSIIDKSNNESLEPRSEDTFNEVYNKLIIKLSDSNIKVMTIESLTMENM